MLLKILFCSLHIGLVLLDASEVKSEEPSKNNLIVYNLTDEALWHMQQTEILELRRLEHFSMVDAQELHELTDPEVSQAVMTDPPNQERSSYVIVELLVANPIPSDLVLSFDQMIDVLCLMFDRRPHVTLRHDLFLNLHQQTSGGLGFDRCKQDEHVMRSWMKVLVSTLRNTRLIVAKWILRMGVDFQQRGRLNYATECAAALSELCKTNYMLYEKVLGDPIEELARYHCSHGILDVGSIWALRYPFELPVATKTKKRRAVEISLPAILQASHSKVDHIRFVAYGAIILMGDLAIYQMAFGQYLWQGAEGLIQLVRAGKIKQVTLQQMLVMKEFYGKLFHSHIHFAISAIFRDASKPRDAAVFMQRLWELNMEAEQINVVFLEPGTIKLSKKLYWMRLRAMPYVFRCTCVTMMKQLKMLDLHEDAWHRMLIRKSDEGAYLEQQQLAKASLETSLGSLNLNPMFHWDIRAFVTNGAVDPIEESMTIPEGFPQWINHPRLRVTHDSLVSMRAHMISFACYKPVWKRYSMTWSQAAEALELAIRQTPQRVFPDQTLRRLQQNIGSEIDFESDPLSWKLMLHSFIAAKRWGAVVAMILNGFRFHNITTDVESWLLCSHAQQNALELVDVTHQKYIEGMLYFAGCPGTMSSNAARLAVAAHRNVPETMQQFLDGSFVDRLSDSDLEVTEIQVAICLFSILTKSKLVLEHAKLRLDRHSRFMLYALIYVYSKKMSEYLAADVLEYLIDECGVNWGQTLVSLFHLSLDVECPEAFLFWLLKSLALFKNRGSILTVDQKREILKDQRLKALDQRIRNTITNAVTFISS